MKRKFLCGLLLLLLASLMLTGCAAQTEKAADGNEAVKADTLIFSAAELTQEPTFVDWTQDGTAMQLIARKDETGAVRLAFNTCQSCGGSPYAWFEYLGSNTLQCQNCGLTFPLDTVGTTRAAGCNPVTITDFTVEGDTVTVSSALLQENVARFTNWKKIPQ
ncbi:MAG: DUF2318 domain-containing protein [Clostridia bacterium]|nr:DUF2318 domain-containing protein [Clostridia bacterium]